MNAPGTTGLPPEAPVRSVYVHAPFCARHCRYCDFAVTVARRGDLDGWLKALEGEVGWLEEEGDLWPVGELSTLFVGGGTPSLMGPAAMAGLKGLLGPERLTSPDLEWTGEANPESLTPDLIRRWVSDGLNRLSLGIQSFQPEALQWLRRLHGPQEAIRAVRKAREAGLENINVDLIFGLPGALERSWKEDLEGVLALGIPHVSVYGLSVEEGTPLAAAIAEGRVPGPTDQVFQEEFLEAHRILTAEGYRHYEVSNFALPGFEARHGLACWSRLPYLGLGNSAHSFRGHRRRWNLRSWHAYQSACLEGRKPWESEELLTAAEVRLERIWLGLRTEGGVPLERLGPRGRALGRDWEREGLAVLGSGALRLTPRGWLDLDRLTVALDMAEEEREL